MNFKAFERVFEYEMETFYREMLNSWDRSMLLWMSPTERETYKVRTKFWEEHKDESVACRGIEQFVKAQYAEFIIRAALWTTRHTGEHIKWRPVALIRGSEDQDDHGGDPEVVLTTCSDTQLRALASYAWPYRYTYGDGKVEFSDWLIRMRLADPAPRDAIRWLYY